MFLLILLSYMNDGLIGGPQYTPRDLFFFETRIRPVLVEYCYECHAADAKDIGGRLLLDSREGMRRGGESGPAVVAGRPTESLILRALRYDEIEMPPDNPLPESIIKDFEEWIRRGAPDPRTLHPVNATAKADKAAKLWSLRPRVIVAPPRPKTRGWSYNPIDRFVLARIEAAGLTPAHDADPRHLCRRLYFDLIGLPPLIEDVERFVVEYQKSRALAVEALVDDLLARPQFGERWGRYWLDVARYGESNGNDGLGRNPTFPHAWRYRDYVIASFNNDTPYDRFITEQIAGDLLPSQSPEDRDRNLVATGFLAMGAKPAKAMNDNFAMDVVADQIDVVGRGIMGFSVACARCHDHKFDPIPTRDYYALAGIFTSTETMWGLAGNEKLTAPPTDLHVLQAAPKVLPPKDFVETVILLESATGKPKAIPKPKWPPGTPLAMGVRDAKKPADCRVNIGGNAKKLGKSVPRGFLTACNSAMGSPPAIDPTQSGRLQLAQWLTSPDHPLTARVMANRIWQHLFGEGIVRTPNDFGVYGQRPTHPELLDYLAQQFIDSGWSVKSLIRDIVLSRTYQQSCDADPRSLAADPLNIWQARHQRRRLDAESLRDSMLAVSGQLDVSPGQGSIIRHRDILVNLAGNLHQPSRHRSVYLCYLRNSPPPELAAFDLPDFTEPVGQRDVSTVPAQALHLFNNPFVIEQAECLAQSITGVSSDRAARVRAAFRRALLRDPTAAELDGALQLVQRTTADTGSEDQAWASLCQALMASSEFRYID